MTSAIRDPHAIDGKFPEPESRTQIIVIGAGPAGVAAALEAASGGASVMLVDENPVSAGLMGTDAPLFFGQRMTGAVQNKDRMLERVFAANPALEEAFEQGVDLVLGTYAWGAFLNGEGLRALPCPIVGLADEERSWMVGFDRLIVAAGARDIALAFRGWDQPGVMGANGLHALLTRYQAFAGRRVLILGSGALALSTALLALDHGLDVAGLVEVRPTPQGPADIVERVRAAGIEIMTGYRIASATGGLDGVEQALLAPIAGNAAPERIVDCDTICLAVGLAPAIELLDVLGVALSARSDLGGHTPVLTDGVRTSRPEVFVAGDAAGLGADPASAQAQGRAAARAALASLGLPAAAAAYSPPGGEGDAFAYQTDWVRALMADGDESVIICQCEEVPREALLAVRQPAYLGPPSDGMAARDLTTLKRDGPVNPDQVKRLTRACMGVCQARRCREQVALTLAVGTDTPVENIPLASYRAPVRPLPLKVLAPWDEAEAMSAGWDVWFGIPTQWTPYADIGTERESLHAEALGGNMHL